MAERVALDADVAALDLRGLVPDSAFEHLVDVMRAHLGEEKSARVLSRSGELTGRYVLEHRVPKAVHRLMSALPGPVGVPLLLCGVREHAWTFVGRGEFMVGRGQLSLKDAPTCRGRSTVRGGHYYTAAFETVLRSADPTIEIREVACTRRGASCCRYILTHANRGARRSRKNP